MIKGLKNIAIGVALTLVVVFMYSYYSNRNAEKEALIAQTSLIEKQVRNVRKLVVTEASYAKVYNYENTRSYGWDFFQSKKSALISSNAQVQVIYDLKKMHFQIDEAQKTIRILNIPPPEIKINPNLSYYEISNGLINKFEGRDLNSISRLITEDLESKIKKSEIIKNSQNRLLSELSQIYVLTQSYGWYLVYKEKPLFEGVELEEVLD